MKTHSAVFALVLALAGVGFVSVATGEEFPPPCDPTPVKKPVKMVRREITVAIIGLARPTMPVNRRPSVKSCVNYWTAAMNREIANKPDLVVLPEGVDSWLGATPAEKRDWVKRRGDLLLKAFQEYARAHRCYLVFNSYRQRKDGRYANCSYALDRDGDVIAVYDKVYPTPGEIEWKELPIVPGSGPVVVETDFGRLSFATCFDLNFRDLLMATAALKPDVIAFCSAYNGDFWQRTWSYTCRSYLVGCTVGNLAKDVSGPSGEAIFHSHDYFQTATVKINTNYRVCHLDYNWAGLRKAVDKYGQRVTVRNPGAVGCVTVLSNDPGLKAQDVVKEFGLEEWDDYYERSVRTRGGPVSLPTQELIANPGK